MRQKLLFTILLLISLPLFVFGQSAGKIVGVVKDKTSGEPLPGVNVSVEGSTLGAASDVDGFYVILNVPVGVYDLRASFIGYGDVLQTGVRVSASVTSEANFELEEAAVEGQAVVVTAQRPLVEKHLTQSVKLFTSEEIENIPVRGFNNILATQNSVVVQDGNIYIRGGRTEEVGYYFDGASSTNPLNNSQGVHIIQEAVEEFQVLAGGYNAEFGGANSGIIRTELKTGSSAYHFSADFQTDKFADEGETFLGTHSFRHHVFVGTISGPLIPSYQSARLFIAYENIDEGDRQRRFSEGFSIDGLTDFEPSRPNDTTLSVTYPDGFTPFNSRTRHSVNGTLLFDWNPLKLRFSGTYTNLRTGLDDEPMLSVLNDRFTEDVSNNYLLSAKATYVLNPSSFVEGSVNLYDSELDREDSYFGNQWWLNFDSLAVAQHTGGRVQYRSRYTPQPNFLLNGIPFERPGDPGTIADNLFDTYRIEKIGYIGGALNFVSQIGRHHELKVGGDLRAYEVRRFAINPAAISAFNAYPNADDITGIPQDVLGAAGRVATYGYDHYGREINSDQSLFSDTDEVKIFGPKKPLFMAAYVQDKIEYNDLIVNVGLRLDYFDTDDRALRDPANPEEYENSGWILDSEWQEVKAYTQVSPRFGFSFPVRETTQFYMQYGKFIQTPELNDAYFGAASYRDQITIGGNFFQAPIGYGLDPIRTTSYEIGFRQQLSSLAAFNITGFYRNIKGQIKVAREIGIEGQYNRVTNGDFATTQGMEFQLQLRRINRLQGQLNYTYTDAEGTGSDEVSYLSAVEQSFPVPKVVQPQAFNQTHRGSIILDYRFGRNDGGPILQELGANMLFSFTSGHPYTFVTTPSLGQIDPYIAGTNYMQDTRTRQANEALNSSVTPWNLALDLRLDKRFDIAQKLGLTVYMRATNLLNTQNIVNVHQRTGSATDDGFISNREISQAFIDAYGGEKYVEIYNAVNTVNGQAYWDQLALQLYGNPRQIFFGIKLDY